MIGLFTKLKLARKTFATKFRRVFYSQYGEDCVLRNWVERRRDGFYVDVGCWHPKKFSNTYYLYTRGWRGINLDLDAEKVYCCTLARPGDISLVAAVSDTIESLNVYSDGDFSLGTTLNAATAKDRSMTARQTLTTSTLTQIIDGTRFRDRPIDVLSVDAEGFDLRVLRGLDFQRYRPAIVLVEQFGETLDEIMQSPIHQYIITQGYTLSNWVGPTLFYRAQPKPAK